MKKLRKDIGVLWDKCQVSELQNTLYRREETIKHVAELTNKLSQAETACV